MDLLRTFFGFSNHQPNNSERFLGFNEEDKSNEPNINKFNVFTDPLEMHRYFEQQMDEVFRAFGFPNVRSFFPQAPAINGNLNGEDFGQESKNLREKFLKKEFVKPHYEESGEKIDNDLDGRLNLEDDSIFKDFSDKECLDIYRERQPFKGTYFSQSVQVKTIKKPDGSLETHRTVRDSQGNEETTITQKIGNKEYTVVKKLDKDGKKETQEIIVNMDENDKAIFQKRDHDDRLGWSPNAYFGNSLFDKFFE